LTWDAGGSGQPTWSPHGEYIAHRSGRQGETQIWIIRSTGGKPYCVTKDPDYVGCPAWSPDGSMIAFRSCRSGNYDIWAVPVLTAGVPLPPSIHREVAWGAIKLLYR
jgi:Tol biopolymer transport system component